MKTDQHVFGRPNRPVAIDCRSRITETAVLSAKNRAEGPWSATGSHRAAFDGMAKNASPIRKLLKIAAKSEAGEAIKAGFVFAHSHVPTAKQAQSGLGSAGTTPGLMEDLGKILRGWESR
jgi:hypothetical protein